jgi:hypothetical protein
MPALNSPRRTPSWFAATSLNPLCRMRVFPLGFPNETHLPLYMDDKRRRGEVRRYDMRTSLVSAQGMKPPFEVGCCDSRFDENPTSPGSADEYIPSKTILTSYIHRPRSHTVGCRPVHACTRQFLLERRLTATSLNPLCRMRMSPLGPPNEAFPPPCHFTGEVTVHGRDTALASTWTTSDRLKGSSRIL